MRRQGGRSLNWVDSKKSLVSTTTFCSYFTLFHIRLITTLLQWSEDEAIEVLVIVANLTPRSRIAVRTSFRRIIRRSHQASRVPQDSGHQIDSVLGPWTFMTHLIDEWSPQQGQKYWSGRASGPAKPNKRFKTGNLEDEARRSHVKRDKARRD